VRVHRIIANILNKVNDYEQALIHSMNSVKLLRRIENTLEKLRSLTTLGLCYGNFESSQSQKDIFVEALEIAEKIKVKNHYAVALNNLTNLYVKLNEFEKAEHYMIKCFSIYDKSLTAEQKSAFWGTNSNIMVGEGHFEKGILCHKKSYEIANEADNTRMKISALYNWGKLNYKMNKKGKSIELLEAAEELCKNMIIRVLCTKYITCCQ